MRVSPSGHNQNVPLTPSELSPSSYDEDPLLPHGPYQQANRAFRGRVISVQDIMSIDYPSPSESGLFPAQQYFHSASRHYDSAKNGQLSTEGGGSPCYPATPVSFSSTSGNDTPKYSTAPISGYEPGSSRYFESDGGDDNNYTPKNLVKESSNSSPEAYSKFQSQQYSNNEEHVFLKSMEPAVVGHAYHQAYTSATPTQRYRDYSSNKLKSRFSPEPHTTQKNFLNSLSHSTEYSLPSQDTHHLPYTDRSIGYQPTSPSAYAHVSQSQSQPQQYYSEQLPKYQSKSATYRTPAYMHQASERTGCNSASLTVPIGTEATDEPALENDDGFRVPPGRKPSYVLNSGKGWGMHDVSEPYNEMKDNYERSRCHSRERKGGLNIEEKTNNKKVDSPLPKEWEIRQKRERERQRMWR